MAKSLGGNLIAGGGSSSIQTATDFSLRPSSAQRTWIYSSSSLTNPGTGLISNWTGTSWMVNITDNNGDDASAMQSASGVLNVTVYIDGVSTYVGTTLSGGWANQNGTRSGIQFADDSWKSSLSGGEEITLEMAMFSSGDAPLADGDILQWVNADSKFKPTQLPTAVSSIDDLSDVDTSTVAPTDGQALLWDNANSQWEPGTISGGGGATEIRDLTDVETVANAQGYEMQQGTFTNSGEFQTNGAQGILIDNRSKNSLGALPLPTSNGSFWFSTSEYGPFTELTINGGVGTAGSFAYSFDFVDRSSLDAVLTGSTTVYFHSVDPAIGPSDGQVLIWDNANSQWEPGTVASSIQTATDFKLQPATGTAPVTRTAASQTSNVPSGQVGTSIQTSGYTYWSVDPEGDESGTILDYLSNVASFPIDVDISGTVVTVTGIQDDSASLSTPYVRLDHPNISLVNGTSYTLGLAAAPTLPLQNNDILQWVDADSKFKPTQLTAAGTRTTLDIGEYADDAAAGTGGVASGALYYNTTSSSYVLKS